MSDFINEEGRTVCGKCGEVIQSGGWPFCPHAPTKTAMIVRDEIPGGVTLENYGPQPVTFYSHSERRRYMEAHGLVEKEKFCPFPGTDKDPQGIPNPKGYMDAKTLDNARVLVSRNGARDVPFDGIASGVLQLLPTEVLTEQEVKERGY